jgi:hypothetical protein
MRTVLALGDGVDRRQNLPGAVRGCGEGESVEMSGTTPPRPAPPLCGGAGEAVGLAGDCRNLRIIPIAKGVSRRGWCRRKRRSERPSLRLSPRSKCSRGERVRPLRSKDWISRQDSVFGEAPNTAPEAGALPQNATYARSPLSGKFKGFDGARVTSATASGLFPPLCGGAGEAGGLAERWASDGRES